MTPRLPEKAVEVIARLEVANAGAPPFDELDAVARDGWLGDARGLLGEILPALEEDWRERLLGEEAVDAASTALEKHEATTGEFAESGMREALEAALSQPVPQPATTGTEEGSRRAGADECDGTGRTERPAPHTGTEEDDWIDCPGCPRCRPVEGERPELPGCEGCKAPVDPYDNCSKCGGHRHTIRDVGEGGREPGDIARWILDALELPADDPSDAEAARMQRVITAALESWFAPDKVEADRG